MYIIDCIKQNSIPNLEDSKIVKFFFNYIRFLGTY